MITHFFLLLALLVNSSLCHDEDSPGSYRAYLHGMSHPGRVPGIYAVMFRKGHTIDEHWRNINADLSDLPQFRHWPLFSGYAAKMNGTVLDLVRRDPKVAYVEADRERQLAIPFRTSNATAKLRKRNFNQVHGTRIPFGNGLGAQTTYFEPTAGWNLQVISSRYRLQTPVINGNGPYHYLSSAGEGVKMYIFDTGIRITHMAFQKRASNFRGQSRSPYTWPEEEPMEDTVGHGTAVAGVAAGWSIGVAPLADIVNVKVINSTGGAMSFKIIDALHAVVSEHKMDVMLFLPSGTFRGSVINMSFGASDNPGEFTLEAAMASARVLGIEIITSATNNGGPAHRTWPCSSNMVVCVVDYMAPGEIIKSASLYSDFDYDYFSGVSFAAPHESGIAAIFTSWRGLVRGGANEYIYYNSVLEQCEVPHPTQKNRLANTGIWLLDYGALEPFRYGGITPSKSQIHAPVPVWPGALGTTLNSQCAPGVFDMSAHLDTNLMQLLEMGMDSSGVSAATISKRGDNSSSQKFAPQPQPNACELEALMAPLETDEDGFEDECDESDPGPETHPVWRTITASTLPGMTTLATAPTSLDNGVISMEGGVVMTDT